MTKIIILKCGGDDGEVIKSLKPIKPVKLIDENLKWKICDTDEDLSSFDYIELICRGYNADTDTSQRIFDMFFAYREGQRDEGTLYLGHWNDGIVGQ